MPIPYTLDFYSTCIDTYLKCYQIMVSKPYARHFGDPLGYGSGFIIQLGERKYFLTAEHVTSAKEERDFVEWGPENLVGVPTGVNDEKEWRSSVVRMGGWFTTVNLKPKNISGEGQTWPQVMDFTYCDANRLDEKCMTYGFFDPKRAFAIGSGIKKSYFSEAEFILDKDTLADHDYFVIGTILGLDTKKLEMNPQHKIHPLLRFNRIQDEEIVLETPDIIDKNKDWAGLSGAPVVTSEGHVIGMLLRVVDGGREIFVKPLSTILRFIRNNERYAAYGLDMSQPFIVVPPGTTMEDVENDPDIQNLIAILDEIR